MKPAQLVIADDHPLVLDGLKLLLSGNTNYQISGEAHDGASLLQLLQETNCDLVITDLSMPGMKGIELVRELKTRHPATPVLVLSMHNDEEIVREILLAEADGYLLKNSGKDQVIQAIDDLLSGKPHYAPEVMAIILKEYKESKKEQPLFRELSAREKEILQLILQEFNSREIAEHLHISKQTVDTHRAHMMEKTGAKTLVGLIKFAIQSGLFR